MKIVDSAPPKPVENKTGLLPEKLTGILKSMNGGGAKNEAQAQNAATAVFQRVLDNQHVLLRDVTLEGLDVPIPLVLIGPSGIRVIYASSVKGIFRAKEDVWEKMDDRARRFQPSNPNLLTRTNLMSRAVSAYLEKQGYNLLEVEPVLYFSDPGTHVDTTRPLVRIVLADALQRYAAGLMQSRDWVEPETVQRIVHALAGDLPQAEPVGQIPEHDAFSFRDLPPEKPLRPSPVVVMDGSEPPIFKKIPFTSRQWTVLGAMVLVNIIILMAFVVLIMATS